MKQARQNETRRIRNRVYRTTARTRVKSVRQLVAAGQPEEAQIALVAAVKSLDKAVRKGILHRNNAARRKSRLFKLMHRSQANA